MILRSVEELKNIRGKCVLVRVDFNVPIKRGIGRNVSLGHIAEQVGIVEDDTRIKAAVPTLQWLMKKGAKVIVMSHFGRPQKKESRVKSQESRVIVNQVSELLKKRAQMLASWDFEEIGAVVRKLKPGEVLMLPNLRRHPGEEKNSAAFARELAGLAQIYVNEAFSVCHRRHASVVGVPKLLPTYAGLQLMKEVEVLSLVLHKSEKPLVVLMGGGKITDKIALMQTMVKRANIVLVGGALATHFFKAMGYGVGASRIESKGVRMAKKLVGNKKIVLPKDLVIGKEDGEEARKVHINLGRGFIPRPGGAQGPTLQICSTPYGIWDIGPQTILEYAGHIKSARTLIWNGPMGLYEVKRYSHGTLALGRLFAARSKGRAFGVIGGGETIDAMKQTGLMDYVDFVSTGGGAMLEFLGGKKLPGIEVLQK